MDLSKLVRPLAWQQMRDGAGELHHVWCADCPALEKRFYAEAEKHRTKVEARRTARILAALDHDAVAALLADAEERGRKAEREAIAALIEGTAYTSSDKGRSLEPVSDAIRGMDMHHATIAAAIRARGEA
jgi:hypothetical protein